MKNNKNCKIVQDLLPNYIENLTNIETNAYIEEHINNCEDCKNAYINMKEKLTVNENSLNDKEINGFKKYNKKLKLLKISLFLIIFILILIFVITTARKMIIISNLYKKGKEYENSDNLHSIYYLYEDGKFSKQEFFVLGSKLKIQGISIDGENITKGIEIGTKDQKLNNNTNNYCSYNTNLYIEENNKKSVIMHSNISGDFTPFNYFYTENLLDLFKSAIQTSIKEKTINGKNYYYLDSFKTNSLGTPQIGIYANKETGLVEYSNEAYRNMYFAREYEFNIVTEKDFVEPSTLDYTIYKSPQEYVKSFELNQ